MSEAQRGDAKLRALPGLFHRLVEPLHGSLHAGGEDCIARSQRIEDFLARAELARDRVPAVEVRLRRVAEEELARAGVGAVGGDAHRAALESQRAVLVGQRPARAAVAVAAGIAT